MCVGTFDRDGPREQIIAVRFRGSETAREATLTVIADGRRPSATTKASTLGTKVYLPQEDSYLLIDTMLRRRPPRGLRVADLCTGSGVVALAAAAAGADIVHAFDMSPTAVTYARAHAAAAGARVDVFHASWTRAASTGPYDLVVCNPPYVPQPRSGSVSPNLPVPALAVDAGYDGRQILDPLCAAAPSLLTDGGLLLVVQSEFADIGATVRLLTEQYLVADVVAERYIPFGPVLAERARWLEHTGRLAAGKRTERLAVIAARKI